MAGITKPLCLAVALAGLLTPLIAEEKAPASVGVGAKAPKGADLIIDGTRKTLDEKWIYWEGPGFKSAMPIKWQIVPDTATDAAPGSTVLMTDDRVADGGKYGTADIVTKQAYGDFRLHLEFFIAKPGGNSGVYLQNRFEIQVLDGDKTSHGMGAVINETPSPYQAYKGVGVWNSYDMIFRAARFQDGKLTEKPQVTMWFNGQKVHTNQSISQVHGGPNSGVDGGNDGGKGIQNTPQGLKLQCEGHDVRYRNTWIKPIEIKGDKTDLNPDEL
jgi:hypothetical protein